MANYFNYSSTLFSSFSENTGSTYTLGDYNMIRSGAYKKLLRAYYDKLGKEESSIKDSINKKDPASKTEAEKTEKLNTINQNAKALKDTAMKLATKGKDSLFEMKDLQEKDENGNVTTRRDYDYDTIVKTVKTFADNYNATLDSVGKIESPALQQKAGWLVQNTKSYAEDLEKVGITADENGRLTVNEETLRKADIGTLSGLFEGATSFGGKTAVKANHVQAYAQFQATNAASAYNNNGAIYNSQTSLNTGNLFDSLF